MLAWVLATPLGQLRLSVSKISLIEDGAFSFILFLLHFSRQSVNRKPYPTMVLMHGWFETGTHFEKVISLVFSEISRVVKDNCTINTKRKYK